MRKRNLRDDAVTFLLKQLDLQMSQGVPHIETVIQIMTAVALHDLAACVKPDPDGAGYFDVATTTKKD